MSSKTFDDLYNEYSKPSNEELGKFKEFAKELKKELIKSSYEEKQIAKFHSMRFIYLPEIHIDAAYRMVWDTTLILSLKGKYLVFTYTIKLSSHGDTIEICRQKIDEFDWSAKEFVKMLPSLVTGIRNCEL